MKGFPNYEIYADGTVIRRQRLTKKNIRLKRKRLIPSKAKNGYLTVRLNSSLGQQKTFYLHRLVWEAFNGEIPKGMEIEHLNGNREDSRLNNLRAVTHKQNCHNPKSLENYRKANARESGKYDFQRLQKAKTKRYKAMLKRAYILIQEQNGSCGVWQLMIQGHCGYPRAVRIVSEMSGNTINTIF